MSLRMLASTASIAALIPLAAPAQNLTPYWPTYESRTWTDRHLHPGSYGAITTAQISSFGYPDVVFLAGTDLMLMVAPALFDAIVPLPGAAGLQALDVIGLQEAGHSHQLAISCSNGLALWNGPQPATVDLISSLPWQGAKTVREARGHGLLVGANPQRELVAFANEQTATDAHAWSVTNLLCAVPFDYDGDGLDEIGIVTRFGIEVRNIDNTVLASFPGVIHAASAERMTMESPHVEVEGLTVLGDVGGNQVLATISSVHQEASLLGPHGAHGLVIADINLDGFDDAVLPSSNRPSTDVLFHLGSIQVPWFELATFGGIEAHLPHGTSAVANPAPPLLADLDGDGAVDSVLPQQGGDTILTGSNPLASGTTAQLKYTGLYLGRYHSSNAYLQIQANHDDVPAQANCIEFLLYDWNGGQPISKPAWSSMTPFEPSAPPAAFDSKYFPPAAVDLGAVLGVFRYARVENGTAVRSWPPTKILVTADDAIHQALQLLPDVTPAQGSIGGTDTGGVGDITKIPPPSPLYSTGG